MSIKAGEMKTLVDFAVWALAKHGGGEKFGTDLVLAGTSLQVFMRECASGTVAASGAQHARLRQAYDTHLRSCKRAGVTFSPKHHLTCHMVARTASGISKWGVRRQPQNEQMKRQPTTCPHLFSEEFSTTL